MLEVAPALTPDILQPLLALTRGKLVLLRRFTAAEVGTLAAFAELAGHHGHFVACEAEAADLPAFAPIIQGPDGARLCASDADCDDGVACTRSTPKGRPCSVVA